MSRIAIIGANGHVGAEVCLHLSFMPNVSIIPICRSELGASLLRQCRIECRIGSVGVKGAARDLLADCDLVVDFSLPRGLPSEVRAPMRANISNVMSDAPRGVPYVFVSTTTAFGMPTQARKYGHYLLARSSYASSKRYGERLTRALGWLRRRPTYVLRLGQVHGEIQGVSRSLLTTAGDRPIVLPRSGETPSDTVFCSTIARAIANIGSGRDAPGRYTLLESPEWTWRRMYEFYAQKRGVSATIVDTGDLEGGPRRSLRSLSRAALGAGINVLRRNQEFLTAQMPVVAPAFEQYLKSMHLARNAAAEVAAGQASRYFYPTHWDGPVPGRRLPSLAREQVADASTADLVQQLLESRLGPDGHNFAAPGTSSSHREGVQ